MPQLPPALISLLRGALGIEHPGPRPPALSDLELSAAPAALAAELEAIVGPEGVRGDSVTRIRHLRGKSTPDLLRIRRGEVQGAPDLVVFPGGEDHVRAVLELCSARRVAVVPYGGGTSVVGGLEAQGRRFVATIALDLRRMNALCALDEVSRVAVLQPGLRGPQAEELLGARGYTLGHFPQSFEYATIGGFAATRSSGQASAGYGRFDDLVVGLEAIAPAGALRLGRAEKSAAGPDLRALILGSEGALGVITSVSMAISPAPAVRRYDGWRFESFAHGIGALRALAQDGPPPTVVRLSDEAETAISLSRPSEIGQSGAADGGAQCVVGYEGAHEEVEASRARTERVLERHGGAPEPDAGAGWAQERFRGPYLRDALLDAGALVETVETATFWSSLPELYRAVGEAITRSLAAQGTPPVILCHISHLYRTGASLYFTVACAQAEDPVAQWHQAKTAAGEAIVALGGSISHHHGVGRDHAPFLEAEIGALGVELLRAIKRTVDPAGILNPGILVPV